VEKDVELAANDITVRGREVIDHVKRAYADLSVSRKAIDIHLASVQLLRQFADISTVKYSTGRISQQDVLKAVVEVSKLHDDLIMLDERAQVAAAQLNTLLDRAPEAPVGPLGEPHERVLLPAPDQLQQLALEGQPELRSAQLGIERAEASLAVAARDYKPDFFVGGGYMLMPRNRDAWTATVGITWPSAPWSRGRLDAHKAEATADVDAARARRRAMEARVRLAVQEAYIRVKAAEQRASLLRTTVLPQSEQTLEVSRAAYQTDRVDFLALLDNQRVLLDAQLSYYRALSDLEQALADLERTVGRDISPAMIRAAQPDEAK
jgi:outer membrane protein TolC